MLGDAIYSILSNDATLTGLVSTRIYPVQAPQRTSQPFVVYRETTTIPTDQKDGAAPKDQKQFQVDIYASGYRDAHTIANRIRTLLDAYSNTVAGVVIRQMWFSDQDDGDFVDDMGFYAVSQVYEARIQR